MAEKKADAAEPAAVPGTEVAKKTEAAIIFKANKPLDKGEFELLSDMVKHESEKTGLKIVLMPFSCDVVEGGS